MNKKRMNLFIRDVLTTYSYGKLPDNRLKDLLDMIGLTPNQYAGLCVKSAIEWIEATKENHGVDYSEYYQTQAFRNWWERKYIGMTTMFHTVIYERRKECRMWWNTEQLLELFTELHIQMISVPESIDLHRMITELSDTNALPTAKTGQEYMERKNIRFSPN